MRTIHVQTELPTNADKVWEAMQQAAVFRYVTRGVLRFPALEGRTTPFREGDQVTGLLWLFHVIPLSRHTIRLVQVDAASRTLRTREHGGLLRTWNHTLHVEPAGDGRCRYSDTVDIDAGPLTRFVALASLGLYRYRQRRWRRLARRHLLST